MIDKCGDTIVVGDIVAITFYDHRTDIKIGRITRMNNQFITCRTEDGKSQLTYSSRVELLDLDNEDSLALILSGKI